AHGRSRRHRAAPHRVELALDLVPCPLVRHVSTAEGSVRYDRAHSWVQGRRMDIKSALDEIDDVLASASKESARGAQATTLLHACVSRYSPTGSTYRTEADNAIKAAAIARTSMLTGVLNALRTDI